MPPGVLFVSASFSRQHMCAAVTPGFGSILMPLQPTLSHNDSDRGGAYPAMASAKDCVSVGAALRSRESSVTSFEPNTPAATMLVSTTRTA